MKQTRTLDLQIKSLANSFPKKYSMVELAKLLEKNGIVPKGNLSNTSKRKVFVRSLKEAPEKSLNKFLESLGDTSNKVQTPLKKSVYGLHTSFQGTKVEKFFKSGDLDEASRVAFLRVNNRVKSLSNLSLDGAALMRRVFSRNNPILPLNSQATQEDLDEQEGMMHIFEGAMLAFRNPLSHDDQRRLPENDAISRINLANYFMSVLDRFESN